MLRCVAAGLFVEAFYASAYHFSLSDQFELNIFVGGIQGSSRYKDSTLASQNSRYQYVAVILRFLRREVVEMIWRDNLARALSSV